MDEYTNNERENLIMKAVIKSLTDLGGIEKRKEVKRNIYDNSTLIPEDYIDYTRKSKQTGNEYKPFDYQFNFAIKHLLLADFVRYPKRGEVELTEKGRKVNLETFDPLTEVRVISESAMEEESKKRIAKKKIKEPIQIEGEEVDDSEDVEEIWRDQLKEALKNMTPHKFEIFARGLMNRMGIELDKSIGIQATADGGLDGFGYITADDFRTTRVALQAKRWEGKVSSPEIDKFRGAMDKYNAEYGIFITTSDYPRSAIEASRIGTRVITLINGDDICDLVAKYEFYVSPVTTYELNDFYFEEE
ncbi:Mrr restriction system protein [Jeotgalibaca dankookensis]|uniref:Mrr restriction system protein n=1 Tax=Jeotgalibaca dankookensis TaxID=708126 RepID=A0A1S6IPD6_9LACT|nr:Mrr restriction system protein [Jeotgalibaca dankookensis]AQS53422.1 Mrr restriction system protein [Jeotgalibaca dankookensis]